jgi:hypothetical protein
VLSLMSSTSAPVHDLERAEDHIANKTLEIFPGLIEFNGSARMVPTLGATFFSSCQCLSKHISPQKRVMFLCQKCSSTPINARPSPPCQNDK